MTSAELVEARFDWAKKQAEELDRELADFLRPPHPYGLAVHINPEYTRYTYRLVVLEQIPDRWPFLVGDLVHNVRSSLDNLVFNLADSPRDKRGENLMFPILAPGPVRRRTGQKRVDGGRAAFERIAPTRLSRVHKDAVAIIERVQPYHGLGGEWRHSRAPRLPHPLSVIHHMSNIDKHRVPHVGAAAIPTVGITTSVEPIEVKFFLSRLVEDNAVVAIWTFPQPVKPDVDMYGPTATAVVALEVPWGQRRTKVFSLEYLLECVAWVDAQVWQPLRPFLK